MGFPTEKIPILGVGVAYDFGYSDGMFKRAVVSSQERRIVRDGSCADVFADKKFLVAMNII
jgi:cobalt/nickel transport system ATP-binding protein